MEELWDVSFIGVRGKWKSETGFRVLVNVYAPCSLEGKNLLWQTYWGTKIDGRRISGVFV